MESANVIIRFFQEGGPFMYPISLVLALGIAIAIERYIYISASQLKNRKLWGAILPSLNKG